MRHNHSEPTYFTKSTLYNFYKITWVSKTKVNVV